MEENKKTNINNDKTIIFDPLIKEETIKKEKKSNKGLLIIIIIVLVVSLLSLGYFIYQKNIIDKNNTNETQDNKEIIQNDEPIKDENKDPNDLTEEYKNIILSFVNQYNSQIDIVNSSEPYSNYSGIIRKLNLSYIKVYKEEQDEDEINTIYFTYDDEDKTYYTIGKYSNEEYYYIEDSGEGDEIKIEDVHKIYLENDTIAEELIYWVKNNTLMTYYEYQNYLEDNEECSGIYPYYKKDYIYFTLFDYEKYGEEFNIDKDTSCITYKYNIKTKIFE